MVKFTPGKWKAQATGYVTDGGKLIAVTPTEADARLISAAPEMHEALERSFHILKCLDPDNSVVEVIRELLTYIDHPADVET
ncbi:MAG: hypothetical protein II832_07285 [Synergistaceae bacterium]|nr:hypothetical protein [Synergistaceae bacterium]MBQ6973113.1 hypothetical protein [Synergistaceae bacterium]